MAPRGPRPPTVGVALAGGASRRMGRDKALLPWAESTLLRHTYDRLAGVCRDVLVADRGRGLLRGARSVPDGPGAGPAAGLLGAAEAAPNCALLVLACDLPSVSVSLLGRLVELGADVDLVVPFSARGPEPLAGWYGPRALAALATAVEQGTLAPAALLLDPSLAVVRLEGSALECHGDPAVLFRNLNTPDDWRMALRGCREL